MKEVSAHWRRIGEALVAFAVAWVLLGLAQPGAPSAEGSLGARFDVDEAEYIAMGVASVAQLLGEEAILPSKPLPPGDPREEPDPWRDRLHATTFGFQSPGLPKLLFGLAARTSGVRQVDPAVFPRFIPKELSKGPFKARRLAAKAVLEPALDRARLLTRLFAAAIAALLFAAAQQIARAWRRPTLAGSLTALLWISSPAVLEASHHVRPGLLPILFWCMMLVAALAAPLRSRPFTLAAALGLCLGLATAGKLNGALAAPLVPLFLYVAGVRRAKLAATTALAAVLSLTVFLAFAPGLWHDTASGISRILHLWRGDLAYQASLYGADVRVPSNHLEALWIAILGLAGHAGPLAGFVPFAGAALALLGAAALIRGARHSAADQTALAWCLILILGSGLILPLDRLRYLTPLAAPAALLAGLLLARLTARAPTN